MPSSYCRSRSTGTLSRKPLVAAKMIATCFSTGSG
jgi:hypothetical protein